MTPSDTAARTPAAAADPVKIWTWRVIGLLITLLVLQIASDRGAPVTTQATIEALVLPVAPRVAGQVARVSVSDNALIEAGAELFRIDATPFQLAVDNAEAQLASSGQSVGASTAQVSTAQAKLAERRANLVNMQAQTERTLELVKRGVSPGAKGDTAKADLARAEADVDAAEAELERAKAALGPQGADNPQIRAASANLETARFNLENTKVISPTKAYVTNMKLATGQYAQTGQSVLTLIDMQGAWIIAYFRENQINSIKVGDRTEIAFDVRPGEIWTGKVTGIGGGIMTVNQQSSSGALVSLPRNGDWMTYPQRLPVRIEWDPADGFPRGARIGSQATVMVRPEGFTVLAPVWWLYMRVVTWLSYVY